jgi:hypothetical protein
VIKAFLAYCRLLPKALSRLYLEWALREIDPMHPDVHYIVHKLAEMERA